MVSLRKRGLSKLKPRNILNNSFLRSAASSLSNLLMRFNISLISVPIAS